MSSKYDSLPILLEQRGGDRVRLRFSEIEDFLGIELPASKRYAAWWSNNPTNSVMTKVWLKAGWRTQEVDLAGEELTFVRDARVPFSLSALVNVEVPDPTVLGGETLDLTRLDEVALGVLKVLARRSGRSIADEAIDLLNEALTA